MIGPLRNAHRILFLWITPIVLMGFLLAVINRNRMPVTESSISVVDQIASYTLIASRAWEGLPLKLHVYGYSKEADPVALVVEVESHFNQADPLLYYTLGEVNEGHLLGAVPSSGKAFYPLPELPNMYDGTLRLYALATHTELGRAALPKASGGTP